MTTGELGIARRGTLAGRAARMAAAATLCWGSHAAAATHHAEQLKRAREDIKHIIIIMQENRSFDHYFGTFPGAHGIPQGTCVLLDPANPGKGCVVPYHDPHDINAGGTHHPQDAQNDIDDGIATAKMDGFLKVQTKSKDGNTPCSKNSTKLICVAVFQGVARHDAAGYHTGEDIPNYWTYAQNFVLQDQLYEGIRTWSYPSHLDMTSEWSARCTNPHDAMSCYTDPLPETPSQTKSVSLPWANLFQLLDLHQVSWKYYVSTGGQPDCDDGDMACAPGKQGPGIGSGWNPVALFGSVQAGGAQYIAQHNPDTSQFFTDVANGTLPQVAWIVPASGNAEHPPDRITKGMEYVTGLVNAVMQSPAWNSTAVFIAWDDWGGFYDHAAPPNVDTNDSDTPIEGFGLRVPGIMVSPYARVGAIDSSVLSFDSYATFIEDVFADSARLDPAGLGIPDNRPDIRDELTSVTFLDGTTAPVGDLLNEFNFDKTPRDPLVLSTAIPVNLAAACGATTANDFLCTSATVKLSWQVLGQATGTPPYTYHVTRDGGDLPGCVTAMGSCSDMPGPGNHLYRVYSVDSAGATSPQSAAFEADEPAQAKRRPPGPAKPTAGNHG